MLESKLIVNLQKLSSKDRQQFRTYVNSPYFNQHSKTIALLDYIFKHLETAPKKLERTVVFKKLFPGEPFHEQTLFNTMSALKKLYHSFRAQQRYESLPFASDIFLLESAYQDNQFNLLTNRAKHLDKKLEQYPYRDSDYYQTRFQYLNTMAYYSTQYEDRSKTGLLQELSNSLDRYFMLEKLKHSCQLLTSQILINAQFDYGLLDVTMDYYLRHRAAFRDDLSIHLYHTVFLSLRHDDDPRHYMELKRMLKENFAALAPSEQQDLYSFANNYCVRQINKGDSAFQKELFELYQEGLVNGLIFTNGLLNEWNYKNITVLGCSLGEFEWTVAFLETYKSRLPEKRRDNSYNYNMAHLNYSQQKYSEALDHLLLVRFSDVKYHLNYNNLLLATYYALNDIEALMSLLDTFRIYVIRNRKMTTDLKKQYGNFIKYAKKLATIKQLPRSYQGMGREERFARLYLELQQSSVMVNRYWLEKTCREEAGIALDRLLAEESVVVES